MMLTGRAFRIWKGVVYLVIEDGRLGLKYLACRCVNDMNPAPHRFLHERRRRPGILAQDFAQSWKFFVPSLLTRSTIPYQKSIY
jgi:hypothetical protein